MKLKILISLFIIFSLSHPCFADFDGALINLDLFRQSAQKAFEEQGFSGKIQRTLFQDAAFATDTANPFDGAMLFVVGPTTSLSDKYGSYSLTYRLKLGNGETSAVLIRHDGNVSRIIVPASLFLVLKKDASSSEIDAAKNQLEKLGPTYEFTTFKSLKRIAIDLKQPTAQNLLALIENLHQLLGKEIDLSFNFEKYRNEFEFGPLQNLDNKQSEDLDRIRDVVTKYIAAGKKFVSTQSNLGGFGCDQVLSIKKTF